VHIKVVCCDDFDVHLLQPQTQRFELMAPDITLDTLIKHFPSNFAKFPSYLKKFHVTSHCYCHADFNYCSMCKNGSEITDVTLHQPRNSIFFSYLAPRCWSWNQLSTHVPLGIRTPSLHYLWNCILHHREPHKCVGLSTGWSWWKWLRETPRTANRCFKV
jgi:hypothetical protein